MVVRSIREHASAHNWFAVTIDLVIVVLGVLIATQVNNWNQARIETEQSRSYRARLIGEVDFNARQYRNQISYYRQVRDHGLEALAALEGRTAPPARDFLISAYQVSQVDTGPPKSYIYDEMVSAGMVERLGDDAIEQGASDYYLTIAANHQVHNAVFPYRTIIREIMPYPIQAAIRRQCGDLPIYLQGRVIGIRLPERCDVAIDSAKAEAAVRSIRAVPRLELELTRYLAATDEKLVLLGVNLQLTEDLQRKLVEVPRRD
jgi:hypothetical protein